MNPVGAVRLVDNLLSSYEQYSHYDLKCGHNGHMEPGYPTVNTELEPEESLHLLECV